VQVVPQDDELLNCSLFQNLAYATPDPVSEDDVIEALRKADAWHFIQVRSCPPHHPLHHTHLIGRVARSGSAQPAGLGDRPGRSTAERRRDAARVHRASAHFQVRASLSPRRACVGFGLTVVVVVDCPVRR
jgi:hypothetical protein